MPELPDITIYLEALAPRVIGRRLLGIRLLAPFLLRTVQPTIGELAGRTVVGLRRLGKRIVFDLEGDLHVVIHLMIAGRLRWRPGGADPPARLGLAAFDFEGGTLILTEAGTRKRASLHLVKGDAGIEDLDPGGLEVLEAGEDVFRDTLLRESHTLKRALTDPRLFSGIGNAYSDEILHRARLSPFRLTSQLSSEEVRRLHHSCREVLQEWIERLRRETGERFPEKVTAFRDEMAVHGRHRQPCPVCCSPVQRIVYAENEANYCPRCQTGGRVLADRALSRLLKDDWPRRIEELEETVRKPTPRSDSAQSASGDGGAPAGRDDRGRRRRGRPPSSPR